jgi:TonB-linked SusC/RagA family outer membrane protein
MKKHVLISLFMLISAFTAIGQSRVVKGVVKSSEDNNPLPGVGVKVEGAKSGTITDVNGAYQLEVPGVGTKLEFTFVGMQTQIAIVGDGDLDISLKPGLELKEVLVTAIGIKQEKKRVGYAIQEVNGADMTKSGNREVFNGLSGKVAGVQVTSSGGTPGSSTYLKLRGTTSLTGDNQPLIIIDGVPFDNTMQEGGNPAGGATALNNNLVGGVGQSNRGIDINPDDIESVTVLKGPAATALYGINASSGALIITTKKGSKQASGKKFSISYSSSLVFDQVNKLPEFQTKYVQGAGGKYVNPANGTSGPEWGQSGSWGPRIDSLFWDGTNYPWDKHGKIVGKSNPNAKTPVTPYDNVGNFFKTGVSYDNAIALSGGSDNGTFRISASHLDQTGIVPLSDFIRTNISLAGETRLTDKLTASGSVTYVNSGGTRAQQGSNTSGIMLGLERSPISFDNSNGATDVTDKSAYLFPDGSQRSYRGHGVYDNPYFTINENKFKDDVNRTFGFGKVSYVPLNWLTVNYTIGTDLYSDRRKQFYAIGSSAFPAGMMYESQTYNQIINSDLTATASTKLGDDVNATFFIGNNLYSKYNERLYTQGDGFNFPGFYNISNAQTVITTELLTRKRSISYYGSAQFDYKDMLFLNVTGRRDKTSTLPLNHNSFFYPSVSLAFTFTEALHMTNNKYLSYGKLRLSYARVGKDADPYTLVNYYLGGTINDGFTNGIIFPFKGIGGFSTSTLLGNPNLKPESTSAIELGTDLRFFSNRIGLDVTYYQTKSTDQIFSTPISGSSGYLNMVLNAGSLETKGWELSLNIVPVKTTDFQWDIRFNWSRSRNKVLSLAAGVENLYIGGFDVPAIYAVVGESYGTIYGGKWLRNAEGKIIINDNKNDAAGYGKPIVDEKNGKIGNYTPNWIGGIANTFTYKRISLYALLDIKNGGDIWNGTKGALTTMGREKTTENRGETKIFDGVKQSSGSPNDISTVLDEAWYKGNGGGFGPVQEQFIEDGSYVRLRELALSYSINPQLLTKVRIAGIDISLFGKNLWLHTKYTGVDPETSLMGASNSQGIDYFNMPSTKSMGVKLRITL